jgi:hypothetical protein
MSDITDEFAYAFSDSGWNPLRALLADVDSAGEAVDVLEGDYARFFRSPTVSAVGTLNDVLFFHTPGRADELPTFWLGTYPWGGLTEGDAVGTPFGWAYDADVGADTSSLWGRDHTVWYRPGHGPTIAVDVERTRGLYASICDSGYSPLRARGWPRVCVLERADGARRGVIIDGHHRLAVLAHRGVRRTRVEIERVVRRGDVASWSAVESGRCSAPDALGLFDAFFDLDGSERYASVCAAWDLGQR